MKVFKQFDIKQLQIINMASISVFFYVLMEWIFFITKPSFMSSINFVNKLLTLLSSYIILLIPGLLISIIFQSVSKLHRYLIWIEVFIPALITAVLSLVLIDNFTYTVLKFGIVNSHQIWRGVYGIIFLIFLARYLKTFSVHLHTNSRGRIIQSFYRIGFVSLLSILAFAFQIPKLHLSSAMDNSVIRNENSELPDIILLGIDGVKADHMSVYGYERDTTPNIEKLSLNAIIAENAFSNAGNTGGSLTSLLTGKLPTETRVVYPPDILVGDDAYQHLPGILKQLGYSTVQITDPTYGDAYSRNIEDGFDVANFRSESTNPFLNQLSKMGGGGGPYFTGLILNRAIERIEHIFYLNEMVNPYTAVTNPVPSFDEEKRYDEMISALKNANGPIFLHVHMLGTHGPKFNPSQSIYSLGDTQSESWMTDFYDDAILDSDKYVSNLFKYLEKKKRIHNTIVILYSDHGSGWSPLDRVPLLMWFPKGQYAGKIHENIQLIDVSPTILDYLNVAQPSWMTGQSILGDNISSSRNIFSVQTSSEVVVLGETSWVIDETKISPPFFQLGKINVIVCDQWFSLNLRDPLLSYGHVKGETAPCDNNSSISPEEAKKIILQHLEEDGYDVSTFPTEIPFKSIDVSEPKAIESQTDMQQYTIGWEYPTTGWDPLIAHGFGQWDGQLSPNNHEAFLESYDEGYRTFEVDIVLSSDNIPLLAHDRQETKYGLDGSFSDYTADIFLVSKFNGKGTTLAGPQLLQLLSDYPDIRVVMDVKIGDQAEAISWFLDRLPEEKWPRLLTNIRSEEQIQELYLRHPSYRGIFLQVGPWRDDLVFTDEDIRDMAVKYDLAGVFTWIDELDNTLDYIANNAAHRRWTPTLESYMIEANKAMIWHTSDDPSLIALRRANGGAVITNTVIPEPQISRVLIISVDGLRPDAIFQAPMPNLIAMLKTSAYSLNAQSVNPTLTLPAHASMLTGLCPAEHGVDWNDYIPDRGFANGMDVFDLASSSDMKTIMVVGKLKLRQITDPSSSDVFEFVNGDDDAIAKQAIESISDDFDLLFLHFPSTDIVGHQYGWLSSEQLESLSKTDFLIGDVLKALNAEGMDRDTLIIITTDHGGHEKGHGTDTPDDLIIPWIAYGPGIKSKQLFTSINTTDTAATIAWALNLHIPPEWVGKPVLEAFGLPDSHHIAPRCP